MSDERPTWTNTHQVIAYALVFSFIGVIFAWMIFPPKVVDQTALTVVNMLLGALVAKFTTIVDFFFGSSQGSKDKDDATNKMVANITGTGAGTMAAVTAAAEAAAVPAAEKVAAEAAAKAAPPAADVAAPPAAEAAAPAAAEAAAPAAAEKAVADALNKPRAPTP